jgi:tyrosyl-tRNA synthetase
MKDALDLVLRRAVQIFSKESLIERINSGKKLKIKLGADPSRPDLHLGHSVVLRALRVFQEMGHEVIFIVGDYTAMIGDPSGKNKTRPSLTYEETRKAGETYFKQATKILDQNKTRIEYNSSWLSKLSFQDILSLTSKYTVARILERDDFKKRYEGGQPICMHELLYPLMQGYDSVALQADVEIGGTDQTFNLLVGRELQKDYGLIPQEVITFPLLIGLDGIEKMSKSLGNYIGLDEPPSNMFEKAMKIPDNLLIDYFRLTTDLSMDFIEDLINKDIREAHIEYGKEIIRMYHGESHIEQAMTRYFEIAKGGVPENVATKLIDEEKLDNGKISIIDVLKIVGFSSSNGEARRIIGNRGIKVDNTIVEDCNMQINLETDRVIQFGKSKFIKLTIKN